MELLTSLISLITAVIGLAVLLIGIKKGNANSIINNETKILTHAYNENTANIHNTYNDNRTYSGNSASSSTDNSEWIIIAIVAIVGAIAYIRYKPIVLSVLSFTNVILLLIFMYATYTITMTLTERLTSFIAIISFPVYYLLSHNVLMGMVIKTGPLENQFTKDNFSEVITMVVQEFFTPNSVVRPYVLYHLYEMSLITIIFISMLVIIIANIKAIKKHKNYDSHLYTSLMPSVIAVLFFVVVMFFPQAFGIVK